ncbi:MAG: hypothetical protein ACREJ3_18960, partial [Polyangiaceae bacterium]
TGVYSGSFSCLYYYGSDAGAGMAPDAGGVGPITGTMSFTLTQTVSTTGELTTTDTANGTFLATTGGFIAAQANLAGILDCGSGKFTGSLLMGIYGLNFNGMPVPDPNNKFDGPLDSDYNGATSKFVNGQWSMAIMSGGTNGACIGTWGASYVGPIDAGTPDSSIVDAAGQ